MTTLPWLFGVAIAVSKAATCPRASVGALLVDRKSGIILSTGFNGSPRGVEQCSSVGCNIVQGHCVSAEHAERNAIYNAARRGVSLEGAALFVTHRPCRDCARAAMQVGVTVICYALEYGEPDPLLALYQARGLRIERLDRTLAEAAGFTDEQLGPRKT